MQIRKTLLILVLMFFVLSMANSQGYGPILASNGFKGGIGLGSVLAVVASWSRNKSVLWAILHAFLGWIYVIWYVFTR